MKFLDISLLSMESILHGDFLCIFLFPFFRHFNINESILHGDFFAFFPFPIFPKNGNAQKSPVKKYSYKNLICYYYSSKNNKQKIFIKTSDKKCKNGNAKKIDRKKYSYKNIICYYYSIINPKICILLLKLATFVHFHFSKDLEMHKMQKKSTENFRRISRNFS